MSLEYNFDLFFSFNQLTNSPSTSDDPKEEDLSMINDQLGNYPETKLVLSSPSETSDLESNFISESEINDQLTDCKNDGEGKEENKDYGGRVFGLRNIPDLDNWKSIKSFDKLKITEDETHQNFVNDLSSFKSVHLPDVPQEYHNNSATSVNSLSQLNKSEETTPSKEDENEISHFINGNAVYNQSIFEMIIKGSCFEFYRNSISSLNKEYSTAKEISTDINLYDGNTCDEKFDEILDNNVDFSENYLPLCDRVLFQSYIDRYLKTLELSYSCPNDINSSNYSLDNLHKLYPIFSFAYLSDIPDISDTVAVNVFLDQYMDDTCIETYEYYHELEFCIHGKLIHSVFEKFPVILTEDESLGIILMTRYIPIKINLFDKDKIYKFLDLLLTDVKCNKLGEIISNMLSYD